MADTGRLQWHPDGNPDKTRTQGIDKRTGVNDMDYSADNTTDDSVMTMRKTPFLLERWRVEPDTRQLQHLDSGEIRSLEPRLMRLLTLLAATPGRVLRRDALIEELWPRVIVNENSLTRAVSELRRKLETDSTCATLIDTIPKTGYRLSAGCRVRDCPESVADLVAAQHLTRPRSYTRPLLGGAMSLALTAVLALGLQGQAVVNTPVNTNAYPLADISLSNADAFVRLSGGRVATASATLSGDTVMASPDGGSLNGTQPVLSSDGRLFAVVRYNEEGSSLLLGSTALPNSPVTVLTTQDTLYNLQWSPLDRAFLFAQSPRLAPASLLPMDERASLVMFDLDTFQTKVLQGPAVQNDAHPEALEQTRGFKLTALTRHFDWLS